MRAEEATFGESSSEARNRDGKRKKGIRKRGGKRRRDEADLPFIPIDEKWEGRKTFGKAELPPERDKAANPDGKKRAKGPFFASDENKIKLRLRKTMRNPGFFCLSFILVSTLACSQLFEEPSENFYEKNYGEFQDPPDDDEVPPEIVSFEELGQEEEDATTDDLRETETEADEAEIVETESEAEPQVLEGDSLEEKLFLLAKACFDTRDKFCFDEKRTLFLASFPDSELLAGIEQFRRDFYYVPLVDPTHLDRATLELEMPFFSDASGMRNYFRKLRDTGIREIAWNPFQTGAEAKILFVESDLEYGAYFKTSAIPVLRDVLGEMLAITRELGMRFYVKMPFRDHPWLLYHHSLLMSQSWDPMRNDEYYLPKLNLLHPYAKTYFLQLVDDLAKYPIDGVLFEDDFTYQFEEGFSTLNRLLYENATGVKLQPPKILPGDLLRLRTGEFSAANLPLDEAYRRYVRWRLDGVQKFVIEVIDRLRFNDDRLEIGLEASPSMILNPRVSFFRYSITGQAVAGMPVDFFVVERRKDDEPDVEKPEEYLAALRFMQRNKEAGQSVRAKAVLANKAEGVGKINEEIEYAANLGMTIKERKYHIGSVNRVRNTDLLFDYLE